MRFAHDAEAEEIVGLFNVVHAASALSGMDFTISSLDRLPGLYGPEELNVYAIVNRQTRINAVISDLSASVVAFTFSSDSSAASVHCSVTSAVEKMEERLRWVSGRMQGQLNQLAATCGKLGNDIARAPATSDSKASSIDDRALNVVVTGIQEDKASSVWREAPAAVLHTAAGRDVPVVDAFRLGRFISGKTRPLLVKLHSVWDRRLVTGGSRKLNEKDEYKRRVYMSADEPVDVRRRAAMDRLKRQAVRDGKEAVVRDGVLLIENVIVFFSKKDGFVKKSNAVGNIGLRTSFTDP